MKPILYIKGSSEKDVRLQKFIKFFSSKNIDVSFWGWNRNRTRSDNSQINYILKGGGNGGKWLPFYYLLWMILLFLKLVFARKLSHYNIIAINFECGFPLFLVSKVRKFNFIYEVYDEFSISHNFPVWLKKYLVKVDHKIMKKAEFVIHVDNNRIRYNDCKSIVIENTPYDYFNGETRDYESITLKFAIIGLLSQLRGLEQIYLFALNNPQISFILAGVFYDSNFKNKLLALSNVESYEKMPQDVLFSKIKDCCGIFSLYDTILEINKLAASNKVYDAMMLGIPVITNPEVINSSFIIDNRVGVVVDFQYNSSWKILSDDGFISVAKELGKNGRRLFLKRYLFDDIVSKRLLPHLY
jgi:hypothetical protein